MQQATVHRLLDIEEEPCSRENILLNYLVVLNKKFSFVLLEISLFVIVLFQSSCYKYPVGYSSLKHILDKFRLCYISDCGSSSVKYQKSFVFLQNTKY